MAQFRIYDDNSSLHALGDFFYEFPGYLNQFSDALVNRIGLTIVTSKEWTNPYSRFKKGKLEYGETVEEVYVNLAKPFSYNPEQAETTWMRREKPDIRAAFHTLNWQKFYKLTIEQYDWELAFLSWGGVSDLISKVVQTLYTSMETDEYICMKYMICRAILDGVVYAFPEAAADDTTVIEDARFLALEFGYNKPYYNHAGVYNHVERQDLIVFVPARLEASVDVNVLASAFNMDKTEFLGQRIGIDSFTDHDQTRLGLLFADDPDYAYFTSAELEKLGSVKAVMADVNWFMCFDKLRQLLTSPVNSDGLYQNYSLHCWGVYSVSPFANAAVISGVATTITGVTVTPTTATVAKGASVQLAATVAGTGFFDTGVTWAITGNRSNDTVINANSGLLFVSPNETATTIRATATSVANPTRNATATITVGE